MQTQGHGALLILQLAEQITYFHETKIKGGGGGGLSADVEENDLVFEIKQAKV